MVAGCQSDWAPVQSGVPQGSILGPLLFILYVNDIPDHLSSPSVFFADDALIYNPCLEFPPRRQRPRKKVLIKSVIGVFRGF